MAEISHDLPALKMWRPNVPLPEVALPSGYRLRLLKNNEGKAWCSCLLNDMGVDKLSQKLFKEKMLDDENVPSGSIFCVEDENGVPVATATSQIKEGRHANLHMVGVREDIRGKGLGFAVCAAAVRKHREEERMECFLTTHDWRLPAIKQYLKLGFLPVLNHETMRRRWEIILKTLGISSSLCVNENLSYENEIIAAS